MLSYTLRRILTAIPVVIAISFVIFWIMWFSPTNFSIDDSLGRMDSPPPQAQTTFATLTTILSGRGPA